MYNIRNAWFLDIVISTCLTYFIFRNYTCSFMLKSTMTEKIAMQYLRILRIECANTMELLKFDFTFCLIKTHSSESRSQGK